MANLPKTALVILFPGVEEVEAVTPIDLLRRAGAVVTVAGLGPEKHVAGRSGIGLAVETELAAIKQREFDLVILPGGAGVKNLRASPDVLDLARRQFSSGRLLAAICAAPTVLKDAGILPGRRYTGHFSIVNELPDLESESAVVRDGNLVTSRGAGTAMEFSLELIRALFTEDAATKVAESICLPR